jgi:preprotein translocase subunit SecG
VRVLTLVVVVVAAYWAKEHRAGYLGILVTMTAVLVFLYVAVTLLLKNRQRYEKARL